MKKTIAALIAGGGIILLIDALDLPVRVDVIIVGLITLVVFICIMFSRTQISK